jgi:penicillin-binding protein-related factor A (putative recombinase)
MKNEREFTTQFIKWLKAFKNEPMAFEAKVVRGTSLPFSAVKQHQKDALYAAKHNKIVWKIPDDGRQKPFDGFILAGVPSFVVVYFVRKGNKVFYMVDVDEWISYESQSPRKSITEEGLQAIGTICHL